MKIRLPGTPASLVCRLPVAESVRTVRGLHVLLCAMLLSACTSHEQFEETTWVLSEVDGGVQGAPRKIVSTDGPLGVFRFDPRRNRLTGVVGCQTIVATYHRAADKLEIGDLQLSGPRCHNARSDKSADLIAKALAATTTMHRQRWARSLELRSGNGVVAVLRPIGYDG